MLHFLRRNFGYSKSECIGVTVLLTLMGISAFLSLYLKYRNESLKIINLPQEKIEELNSAVAEIESLNSKKNYKNSTKTKNKKITTSNDSLKSNKVNNFEPKNVQARHESKKKVEEKSININTATAEELQKIHGIGKYFSQLVIKYRDKIGGFIDLNQLKVIEKLSDDAITNLIKICYIDNKFEPRKLNINEATFKEILKLPYMNYEIVKKIFNAKKKKSKFSTEDFKIISEVSDEEWIILCNYIST